MSSSTPRKRKRNDENENTPARPSATRGYSRTPLSALQPSQRVGSTPVNKPLTFINNSPSTPSPFSFHQPAHPLQPLPSTPLSFVDAFTPTPPLKPRLVARQVSEQDLAVMRRKYQAKVQEAAEKQQEVQRIAEEENSRRQVNHVLQEIRKTGLSIHGFLHKFLTTRDPSHSSQASNFLINHGRELFDDALRRQPDVAQDWAISTVRELIVAESEALASHFRPRHGASVTEILAKFSVKGFLSDAKTIAPSILGTLQAIGIPGPSAKDPKYKDRDLILATTVCMLTKCRNEHSTTFQTTMCMYFLACGTSRSLFDVLNHAGITLSYSQAIHKLKALGQERLAETRAIVRKEAFMGIWDNVNIPFDVSQQRADSKAHFDSGSTSTVVPLHEVAYGELSLDLKPPRKSHKPVLDFNHEDLLPSRETAMHVQEGQLWHIQDILYDAFPALRARLKADILPPPAVKQISLHQTRQYPLPAMHIDESSLEGTLHVLSTMFQQSLQLTEEDIKCHGIILCAGDQLSISLLDKVSAIRRDDTNFLDNVGRYTEGQDGLLHVKFSHTRMIANEYWGKPNSKSPWSLWKINTLLGRKAVSAGWKAKSMPPFRPMYELILDLTLPANILDGFRLHCKKLSLDEWVKGIKHVDEVAEVAKVVLDQLCSGRRVHELRQARQRDVPFENICLFNRDSLHLRQLKYAIKRGDVGAVLNIITHIALAFRGTGQTPKYADALFHIIVNLRQMDPKLRNAWLVNWLANLSGKANGFKEMDLLQEHQNFWLKVIYTAKGSNRSWEWLSMVSVSIFALRDIIRKMQKEFDTPLHGISHTNPSTATDIKTLCDYLQMQELQTCVPGRENNSEAMPARDLIQVGSSYANKPSAFRNFTIPKFKTTNHGIEADDFPPDSDGEAEDEAEDAELGGEHGIDSGNLEIDFEDLLMDEDEFPGGSDGENYLGMVQEIVSEFLNYS